RMDRRKQMRSGISTVLVSATAFFVLAGAERPVLGQSTSGHRPPKTDAEMIANATSAGPALISRAATIVAMDGDKMRRLRQGKNEWTCVPDDPGSAGNDPMCLDRNAMEWLQAVMEHKDAPKGKMGLVYMLQGGSDASNDDPFATQPSPGAKWV